MAAKLTGDMKRVVTEQRLAFVATVCPDGTPNLSPKGTIAVWDDAHLVFADIRSGTRSATMRAGDDAFADMGRGPQNQLVLGATNSASHQIPPTPREFRAGGRDCAGAPAAHGGRSDLYHGTANRPVGPAASCREPVGWSTRHRCFQPFAYRRSGDQHRGEHSGFEGVQPITWLAPEVFASSNDESSIIVWSHPSQDWTYLSGGSSANSGDSIVLAITSV
jgi:hypothetical protein